MRGAMQGAKSAAIYGVGIGPGDPALLTLRAVEVLQRARAVMAPAPRAGGESLALSIAREHLPAGCEVVTAHFPMTEDRATLEAAWGVAAAKLLRLAAAAGAADSAWPTASFAAEPLAPAPVAFITLGDALLYSTWSYVLAALARLSPETAVETVPGITAMAACAAALGRPLAEGREPLLVWPDAPPADAAALLERVSNIVFMKADRHLEALADLAEGAGARAAAVRRASQPGARTTTDLRAWAGDKEYFTTVLMHREEKP